MAHGSRRAAIAAMIAALALAGVSASHAQTSPVPADTSLSRSPAPGDTTAPQGAPAPPDTALHRFLDTLSDSTDTYFGLTAQPADTAGLDSALAARLERPWLTGRGPRRVGIAPSYSFDRANGSIAGGRAVYADRNARMMVSGDVSYAFGAEEWLGGGEVTLWRRREGTDTRLTLLGGWRTGTMDRDLTDPQLAMVRAFLNGSDRQHYLRREGYGVRLGMRRADWYTGLSYSDWLETPLELTTTWDLFGRELVVPFNLGATSGRMRGIGVDLGARVPHLPLRAGLDFDLAGLGGDFDYRRTRLSLGGEFPIARIISVMPQLRYGRLDGDAVPQAAFYLGGPRSLRSLHTSDLAGTGLALARLDVVGAHDVLALAHFPHPAFLPIQAGAFIASGTVWGADPFGGPARPGVNWPAHGMWLSETGVSILYRPGIPDDDGYMRIEYAWRIGPGPPTMGWSVSYSRMLDLIPHF